MNELLTAITTKVNEQNPSHNAFYNSIGGRFYSFKAPQDTDSPYCVLHLINNKYDFTFTEDFADVKLRFTIYSDYKYSQSEASTIFNNLKSLFDWVELTVSGYTHFICKRNFSNLEWIDAEEVWQYVVEYDLFLQET